MTLSGALNALKSSSLISWKSSGRLQQTIGRYVEVSGNGLHSGKASTVRIWPEYAGKGRHFDFQSKYSIPASIDFAQQASPLCTSLSTDGLRVRTVEHLLSALEAAGVDNCRIEICNNDDNVDSEAEDSEIEVPILDGSASGWVDAIEEASLVVAVDQWGNSSEQLSPYLNEPVPAIGRQWFSIAPFEDSSYIKQIASSRTFCLYDEVESMRNMGLIKGGSLDNALVCSASEGWLNPPLRFLDEPCRHKILDLVGDLSLFARLGNQGLPVAHIIVYKGGHSVHADFVRRLNESFV
ncbi:probable UDP-3-O-acyl-N-acetylglucosamine deacetylase 1, mitochondrial isoform X2 [Euphorbia lathyris]|uniref:probable UDP-3-O-acyl-N-acetylglucosamine deacetylase 1, mitochondrial isoform X2 n=1 Tax=Euphorbia lathyris TaxID=212925 RepID=UPI0033132E1B